MPRKNQQGISKAQKNAQQRRKKSQQRKKKRQAEIRELKRAEQEDNEKVRKLLDLSNDQWKQLISKINIVTPNEEIGKIAQAIKLESAVQMGHIETVRGLLDLSDDQGKRLIDIDTKNEDGKTPLMIALEEKQEEIADLLIEKGADVNCEDDDGSALIYAVTYNSKEMVEKLLEKDAEINYSKADGATALHFACDDGQLEIAKLLVKRGANIDAQNKYGKTPQMIAIDNNHNEIADLLREKGAGVNAKEEGSEVAEEVQLTIDNPTRIPLAKQIIQKYTHEIQEVQKHEQDSSSSRARDPEGPQNDVPEVNSP